jgi:hypothetical protein
VAWMVQLSIRVRILQSPITFARMCQSTVVKLTLPIASSLSRVYRLSPIPSPAAAGTLVCSPMSLLAGLVEPWWFDAGKWVSKFEEVDVEVSEK